MKNYILIGLVSILILFSLYLIGRTAGKGEAITETVVSKVSAPSPVNINLDSGFNNFREHSTLTFDKLHCELYEEKNKHINALGKANLESYDGSTSELLLSLIKEINKVKTQKNLLQNLKLSKPSPISLDTSKLERLYNNLMKTKDLIDSREGQIKILKQNFKPSVVSGKQFEIDVQKQLITYLEKRLGYLKTLRPKVEVAPKEEFQKVGRTLDNVESTLKTIMTERDQNKNRVKSNDQINKLVNLRKYWELRLEEVKKCESTDEGYRSGQGNDIYRELEKLGKAQKENWNEGYCMELKKHLILRLVKQFDAIQSDYSCIRDKGRIQNQLRKLDDQIENLRKQAAGADYDPNKHDKDLEKLKRNYADYSSALESEAKRAQIGYDADTLKDMIFNTQTELNTHRNRLNDLNNGKKTDDGGDDPQKIVNLVNQNIKLKADYCKDFQEYQRQNQILRNKLDQISADRSVQHITTERYLAISNQIKNSLNEISKIKESITGKLRT